MSDTCERCGHAMIEHDELDHQHGEGRRPAVRLPDGSYVQVRRRTTVCTQDVTAGMTDPDLSPWDGVCGCVWTHDAEGWTPWSGEPDPPEPYAGTPVCYVEAGSDA